MFHHNWPLGLLVLGVFVAAVIMLNVCHFRRRRHMTKAERKAEDREAEERGSIW